MVIQNKKGYFSSDEMKMLSGALEFKSKTVEHIMTPMEKVFMVSVSLSSFFPFVHPCSSLKKQQQTTKLSLFPSPRLPHFRSQKL